MPAKSETPYLATIWFQVEGLETLIVQFPTEKAAHTARSSLYRIRAKWKRESETNSTPYDKYIISIEGQNLKFLIRKREHDEFTIIIPTTEGN